MTYEKYKSHQAEADFRDDADCNCAECMEYRKQRESAEIERTLREAGTIE